MLKCGTVQRCSKESIAVLSGPEGAPKIEYPQAETTDRSTTQRCTTGYLRPSGSPRNKSPQHCVSCALQQHVESADGRGGGM